MEPLVSLVVPIYNSSKFIEKSIKSICKQIYQNIEIILVNDGTKDNSIELALTVINKYNRKYKLINQKNLGLSSARNSGIDLSAGKYICFIDSDDILDEGHISHLVSLIIKKNLKVVFSDFELTSEDKRDGNKCKVFQTKVYSKDELFHFFVLRKPAIHCCTLLIDNNYLKSNKLYFNSKLKYGEDTEYMWRLFSTIQNIGRVQSTTYKYLIRKNSIMTSVGIEKGIVFQEELHKSITLLSNNDTKYIQYYKWAYYRNILGWLHSMARNADYNTFKKGLKTVDMTNLSNNLKNYPNLKIKILVSLLKINSYVSYRLLRGS
ncbi:glycosyltransferase family 2 protein [Beduini massiliensis]|uniref:glycosyltransferase family 2 protein n=1 Tax=Beduini massiliensis TaxID=1585974 RepID=UPI00059AAD7D|nr:glycosyltransferase family 2 protein [Beduini massiliensis]